jgi:hypothetical protein
MVRLQRITGLPEDIVVNTFHFFTTGTTVTPAQAAEVATKVIGFYNSPGVPPTTVSQVLSSVLSRDTNRCEVKVYDQGTPMPRQPVVTQPFTLGTPSSGSPLPSEVALVLSLRAVTPLGGIPARSRGRVYVGPLNQGALGNSDSGDLRPNPSYQATILDAGRRMLAAPADLIAWSVYSTRDLTLRRVTRVIVDNAFDTQRRRGAKPTARIEATISEV